MQTKFKALFEFSHVTDMFRTCFKKREGYNRAMIWLTIASLAAAIFVMGKFGKIFFFFFQIIM